MRKLAIIATGSALLIGGCGLAATQWAQSRAEAEVERTFSAVRALGATVSYDKPRFETMARRVTIDNVKIGFGDGPDLVVARMVASGVGLFTRDFEAATVEISDVEARGPVAAGGEPALGLRLPKLTASSLHLPGTAPAPAADGGTLSAIGNYLSLVRFASLSTDEIVARVRVPAGALGPGRVIRPPGGPSNAIEYRYSGVLLERMEDGRLAKLTAQKVTLTGPTGEGTIEGFGVEALDLLPMFKTGLARRTSTDGFYPVQGRQWIGAMAMKTPDGGEVKIGGMSGTGLAIDPEKLSLHSFAEIYADASTLSARPQANKQAAEVMARAGRLYEGMRTELFEVKDMQIAQPGGVPGAEVKIGRLAMMGLDRGRIAVLRVDGIAMSSRGGRPGRRQPTASQFEMERFDLKGIDMPGLMRLSSGIMGGLMPGAGMPSTGALLGLVEGIEVRGVDVPDFGKGQLKIGVLDLTWGRIAADMPGETRLKFQGVLPLRPTDPTFRPLTLKGIRSMAIDMETRTTYSAERRELVAEAPLIDLQHLGRLEWRLVLSGLTPELYRMLPLDYTGISRRVDVSALDLKLTDGGLVGDIYLPAVTPPPGGMAPPDPILALKAQLLEPDQPGGNLGAMLDAFGRFLSAPGQTMTLGLKAIEPVKLGDMSAAQAAERGQLAKTMERFAVDVGVRK